MELQVFGDLELKVKDGSEVTRYKTPYITLTALCYLAIEGNANRKKVVAMFQADDVNKTSQTLRSNETIEGRDESVESYEVAKTNFHQNLFKLRNKLDRVIKPINNDADDFAINDTISCNYTYVLELLRSDATNKQEAIDIYEQGLFLANFESSYPKRHLKKAEALKNWVLDRREEILTAYLLAKAEQDEETLQLKDLRLRLPENPSGAAGSINTETLLKFYSAKFEAKEKSACLKYIEDYVPKHLQHISIEEEAQEVIFKVLLGIYSFAKTDLIAPDTEPLKADLAFVQSSYGISDEVFEIICSDLEVDGWFRPEGIIPVENKPLQDVLKRYLARHYSDYYDFIALFCLLVSYQETFEVLQHFLSSHSELLENKAGVIKLVNNACHELINQQEYEQALRLSDLLLQKLDEGVATETHFWHVYALEQSREYARAKEFFAGLDIPKEEYELRCRLSGVKASVLARSSERKEDMTEARALANKISKSDSRWATAEAHNTLGVIELKTDENKLFKSQSYFRKAGIGWDSLGESIRQMGALSNLAVVLDRNGKIEEAEEAYDEVLRIAQDEEVNSTFWVTVLQNKFMFYCDCIQMQKAPSLEKYIELNNECIKDLLKALEKEDILPHTKAHTLFNIAIYHEDMRQNSLAVKYYKEALEISKVINLGEIGGLARVAIGALEKDFDKIEMGIKELIRGGYDENAEWCIKDYVVHLEEAIEKSKALGGNFDELQYRLEEVRQPF